MAGALIGTPLVLLVESFLTGVSRMNSGPCRKGYAPHMPSIGPAVRNLEPFRLLALTITSSASTGSSTLIK